MKTHANSNTNRVDLTVVGGGLAGCSLVWQALRLGLRVAMIDYPNAMSSSRVAAGLVTPITGSRLALSWRYLEFFRAADEFYRFVERETKASFWSVSPAMRIFSGEQERDLFEDRWAATESYADGNQICVQRLASEALADFAAPYGGFLMSPAGRLTTELFLQVTRDQLAQTGLLYEVILDLDQELLNREEEFYFPTLDLTSKSVCLAQGVSARSNRWFSHLALHPARGDILKLRSEGLSIEHIVHRDAWIVPLDDREFLVGATYSRDWLDCQVDSPQGDRARAELQERWLGFFKAPGPSFQFVSQRAAVRPASYDRHPLIGPHHEFPQLLCLNGLGSKGSLLAPRLSQMLMDYLLHSTPIEKTLSHDRRRI